MKKPDPYKRRIQNRPVNASSALFLAEQNQTAGKSRDSQIQIVLPRLSRLRTKGLSVSA